MMEPDHDQAKSEAVAGQMVSILNNAAVVHTTVLSGKFEGTLNVWRRFEAGIPGS